MDGTTISILSFVLAATGVIFTYYKFFREGSHRQRIEFDIEFEDLGTQGEFRVVEVSVTASNKGHVEQKFDEIKLTVRGIIEGQDLREIEGHEPRLSFPEKIGPISVISDKYKYFFVRPGVTQRFPVVIKVPNSWCLLHARSTFKYFGLNEIHSSERAFAIGAGNA